MTHRIAVDLPDHVWGRLASKAETRGITVSALVSESIVAYGLGMNPKVLAAQESALAALRAVRRPASVKIRVGSEHRELIRLARLAGCRWSPIGFALGVSDDAVARFMGRVVDPLVEEVVEAGRGRGRDRWKTTVAATTGVG